MSRGEHLSLMMLNDDSDDCAGNNSPRLLLTTGRPSCCQASWTEEQTEDDATGICCRVSFLEVEVEVETQR
jgi:hypothetical protein